jgi:hypothetical protein
VEREAPGRELGSILPVLTDRDTPLVTRLEDAGDVETRSGEAGRATALLGDGVLGEPGRRTGATWEADVA